MKCSYLLKPNKIAYTHQNNNSKQNPEPKVKMSSRQSAQLNERSSMADLMIIANPSKKNILSMIAHTNNKQNQPKNIEYKQTKKELSSSRPHSSHNNIPKNKQFDMYLSDKMPKPQKLNRNMSMHISSSEIIEEIPNHNPRMNNSSMSNYTKQILPGNTKKRKLSKPLMENCSLLNLNRHRHSSVILSRSPLSDKNVLVKEFKDKKQEKASQMNKNHDKHNEKNNQKQYDKNYDSCKGLQSQRTIEPWKNSSIIGENKTGNMQILQNNKFSMGLIKKSKSPKQNFQDEQTPKTLITKTQLKTKSILVLKQNKGHQTSRKIKRSKLLWLFIINQVYAEATQGARLISLYRLVQQLKVYEKKPHPSEEIISGEKFFSDNEQQTTLTQLLLFVKVSLLTQAHLASSEVVLRPHGKQIDPEKTQLTFNNLGQIIFSQESMVKYLEQFQKTNIGYESQNKVEQKPKTNQCPSTSQIKNPHNMSTKQDEQIVQTARFQQNNHSHHHSRQSSDGMNQRVKKKNIFMDPNHQQPYTQAKDLINAKLQKSANPTSKYPNPKRPMQNQIPYPSPVDKSFISRKSSSTSTNRQPKSNGTTNKQISHCSIQDISQILINQNQKPLVTSFNKKFYPSPIHHSGSYPNPFPQDSFMDNSNQCKQSNGIQEISMSKGMESGQLQSCRIQALNMNSSLLFLESVILNNLYHTNFNVSFSQEPIINDDQSFMKSIEQVQKSKQTFNKLEDVIQQVQNILKSMKNLFTLDCDSITHNDKQFLTKNITKESIKIQDLTQMQQFLSQFIDYKLFRKQSKSSALITSELLQKSEYFNAVKLTQNNLTSFHTKKAAQNIIKSPLIAKYFSFIQGIRINQGPFFIQNIDKLLLMNQDKMSKVRILNLSNNELTSLNGLMNVIEANMGWLEFLNLSNNKIESIQGLFGVLGKSQDGKEGQSNGDSRFYIGDRVYIELRELHLKNNKISCINYKIQSNPSNYNIKNLKPTSSQKIHHFPKLQLLDLRSNLISSQQKSSIEHIIYQSPNLSIMSLKQNPILCQKSHQKSQLQNLMNQRSIYEYDSLQMMSAYIKYKNITFSDSGENCCSLVENFDGPNEKQVSLERDKDNMGYSDKLEYTAQLGSIYQKKYKKEMKVNIKHKGEAERLIVSSKISLIKSSEEQDDSFF